MRKIKITKEFEDYVKNFNKKLFVSTRNKNFELPINRLNKIIKELRPKYNRLNLQQKTGQKVKLHF
ncbi:hypothetical protein C21_04659 [Arenibacter sp. NBRC 103722]|nr:hypothetical protein C21_04659 [Arenibacter sp. NBRC 103722]